MNNGKNLRQQEKQLNEYPRHEAFGQLLQAQVQ